MGRAEQYLVDLGLERMVQVFNIYGQSCGGKEDIATAEAILEAVREERDQEPHLPTLIVGDANADPSRLRNLKELVAEGWVDIGLHADWWGGTPAENTCASRAGAKESRIDVVFASPEAALYIHKVIVKWDLTRIPTHAAIRFKVSRNTMQRKRLYARTLPQLKRAMEAKGREDFEKEYEKQEEEE